MEGSVEFFDVTETPFD